MLSSPYKEMTGFRDDGRVNYPDLIIVQCTHTSKHHIAALKLLQLLRVN